jgi:glycosyltransferase involved in cell wall biosynthesis
MFNKITVLAPTRGRPERLHKMLDSFYATTYGSADVLFRVDDDDVETRDIVVGLKHIVGPRLEGYRSLPTFFNELALAADGDVLMIGNDDMVFQTPGWDAMILDAANRYPDGIFNIGVATHNHDNFPFSTVSKRVVETLGFLYDPRIFWGDIFLLGVMAAFGRAVRLPAVTIDHDWAGVRPDAIFLAGEEVRRANWMEHHQAAIDDAVVKLSQDPEVMKLRAQSSVVDRGGWSIVETTEVRA